MTDERYSIDVPAPGCYTDQTTWAVYDGDKKVAGGHADTSNEAFEKANRWISRKRA